MPLRDHFHGWLRREIAWGSFCCAWTTHISAQLNGILPEGFRAAPYVSFRTELWHDEAAVIPPTQSVPFELAGESVEVRVHGHRDGRYVAAAIEVATESNHRQPGAFVSECETYLRRGVGLVILDAVTTHETNLHDELMVRLGHAPAKWGERLYAAAYRATEKDGGVRLEVWQQRLELGAELPTMPLWLLYGPCVPVHFEPPYVGVFRGFRLPTEEPR